MRLRKDQATELEKAGAIERPLDRKDEMLVDIKKAIELQQRVLLDTLKEMSAGLKEGRAYRHIPKRDEKGLIIEIVSMPIEKKEGTILGGEQ